MKQKLLIALAALAFLGCTVAATAATFTDDAMSFYVGGKLGIAHDSGLSDTANDAINKSGLPANTGVDDHPNSLTGDLMIGMDINPYVGLRASYDWLGKDKTSINNDSKPVGGHLTSTWKGPEFDVLLMWPLDHETRWQWTPYLKLGAAQIKGKLDIDFHDNTATPPKSVSQGASRSKTLFVPGIGVRFDVADRWQGLAEFDYFQKLPGSGSGFEYKMSRLTVGLIYRFGKLTDRQQKNEDTTQEQPVEPLPVMNDADADGVPDSVDQCADTPANVIVDSKGCELDSDGDGIPNSQDKCPNTPKGALVDEQGCKKILTHKIKQTLYVSFKSGKAKVPEAAIPAIAKIAKLGKQYPDSHIVLNGYTDITGSSKLNRRLSAKRAAAVAKVLISYYSIDDDRIETHGFGPADPIASNDTAAGRAKNRRVEVIFQATVKKVQKKQQGSTKADDQSQEPAE